MLTRKLGKDQPAVLVCSITQIAKIRVFGILGITRNSEVFFFGNYANRVCYDDCQHSEHFVNWHTVENGICCMQ